MSTDGHKTVLASRGAKFILYLYLYAGEASNGIGINKSGETSL